MAREMRNFADGIKMTAGTMTLRLKNEEGKPSKTVYKMFGWACKHGNVTRFYQEDRRRPDPIMEVPTHMIAELEIRPEG